MAKILIFNNFLQQGQDSILAPRQSKLHRYRSVGPGRWRANPYGKTQHMGVKDLLRRIIACVVLWFRWRKYDVLIVDGAVTGLFVSFISLLNKGHRKLVIDSWNVPRRRKGFWKWFAGMLYQRVDFFFVHSRYDIQLTHRLYNLPEQRFVFRPFTRNEPANGELEDAYLFEDRRPFVFSFGGNARDYRTFFRAIEGTDLYAIVVARQYNLEGLTIPDNVRAFCNIPLEVCDNLVRKCKYTVFTFDGSEPSCGQISIVTSFMTSKPVICTDWVGVEDYVTDGVNGILVKMGNADDLRREMLKLSNDKQLYARLSAGARNWSDKNADPLVIQREIDGIVTSLTSPRIDNRNE
jgi:glycosyltransferase involved in cell wall biosynthesis